MKRTMEYDSLRFILFIKLHFVSYYNNVTTSVQCNIFHTISANAKF